MDKKPTDVKHVTDYINNQQRNNLIADIDDNIGESPAGTFDNVKDQYTVGETRNILLALASGFPAGSPWHDDLTHFIGLADQEFGLSVPEEVATNGKSTAKRKRK